MLESFGSKVLVGIILFIMLFPLFKFVYHRFIKTTRDYDVYVLNMSKDRKRLKQITKELDNHGIKFTRINAVNGETLNKVRIIKQGLLNEDSKKIPKKRLGCTMSHRGAWVNAFTNRRSYNNVLVLEDNVKLHKNFKEKLDKVSEQLNNVDYDICYLGRDKGDTKETKLSNNIVTPIKNKEMRGYIVKRESLPKLLKEYSPINGPIDEDIWEHKNIKLVSSSPLLVLNK